MPKQRDLSLPKLRASGNVDVQSLDAEKRTVELLWYTGAFVTRFNYWDGEIYELAFSMDPKAVRLNRMKSGAPLLNSHAQYDLSNVIGVVENAWIDSGKGHCVVRFSEREDVGPIFEDVKSKIIRNVSMGAVVHQMKEITEKGDRTKKFLAIDWEPMEVSLVAVGADPGAQALSDSAEKFPCQINFSAAADADAHRGKAMKVRLLADIEDVGKLGEIVEIEESAFDVKLHSKDTETQAKPKSADSPSTVARLVDEEIERDQQLAAQAKRVGEHYGLDDLWVQKHINLGTPIKALMQLAAEERKRREPPTRGSITVGDDHDSWESKSERMAVALAARAVRKEVPAEARAFAQFGFIDLAYETIRSLRIARGVDQRDRSRVVELALSTSDYPNLLANASNKVLLPAYAAAVPTYRQLCIRQDLPDFKSASVLNVGDFPQPLAVGENGEIKLGHFAEQKNTVALGTYGRRLAFSRQMLVNDDLNAFGRVLGAYGVRIADFENAAFFTLLGTVGPTLGDTGAMFNATALTTAGGHANYTSSGTAISATSITVGATLMQSQTGIGADNLGDGIKLNIMPRYLLAAPGKRELAFQYTSAAYVPSAPTSQNPWAGKIEPILDANLSGNRWWLFADPALFPNFAYGSLSGSAGPRVMSRSGFEVEGVELRVAFDFYVGGIDWRGGYCNAGA